MHARGRVNNDEIQRRPVPCADKINIPLPNHVLITRLRTATNRYRLQMEAKEEDVARWLELALALN
jgi:hypothetical protein